MLRKSGRLILVFIVWLFIATVLLILMTLIIPPSDDGTVELGPISIIILLVVPIICTRFLFKKKGASAKQGSPSFPTINKCKRDAEKTENLSEWEKWKLEKASHISTGNDSHTTPLQLNTNLTNSISYSDELFPNAVDVIIETGQASVSILQRRLNLGYSRAAQIVDQMEELGIISSFKGSKPRELLISKEQWDALKPRLHHNYRNSPPVNIEQIMLEEENWRRTQRGLSPIEVEFDKVDHMDGHAFEQWCAALLRKSGFTDVSVTQGSGDQGVDILAKKEGIKYAVQCKCYSSDLGNTSIQQVHAGKAFYDCQIGAVMTNRYFTKGARMLADKTGVLLWDRSMLEEMLKNI